MNDLALTSSATPLPPAPVAVSVRPATLADAAFIDSLQKMHGKMVGFMPTAQLHAKIAAAGQVLVAEDVAGGPVGYVISQDRYQMREDVGIAGALTAAAARVRGVTPARFAPAAGINPCS